MFSFLMKKYLGMEFLGHVISVLFYFARKCPIVFFSLIVPFAFSTMYESCSCQHLVLSIFLILDTMANDFLSMPSGGFLPPDTLLYSL